MKNNQTGKYTLIMVSGCLWGTIGLFIKLLDNAGSSPSYTTFLRMSFAFLILAIAALIKEGAGSFRISRRTLITCMLMGVVSMSINNLCYTNAVSLLGMSLGAALLYMAPVFTAIESRVIFSENIGKYKIAAIALNVIGCTLAATGGDFSGIHVSAAGILFGIGAAFAYSTQNIFGRMATDDAPPFTVAAYNFMFAALFTLLAARPFAGVGDPMDPKILLYGFLFALIPTAAAYLLYFVGISGLTESSKVPVLCSLELVVAAILGAAVFSEHISIGMAAGIAMIFVSIIVINRR